MQDENKKTIRVTSVLHDEGETGNEERDTANLDGSSTVTPDANRTMVLDESGTVTPDASRTMVLDESGTATPDASRTTLRIAQGGPREGSTVLSSDFVLKGLRYENVLSLSSTSGEAQVFLVRRNGADYALKLYYPHFKVNKELVRRLKNMNFEMIVHTYDYGYTYLGGEQHDYELMEYMEGGTLDSHSPINDINRFRRIALQAAAALAYIHNDGVIHKDVKPANFFFRDNDGRELALGDFGISSIIDAEGGRGHTSQARTPLYAAPEMYRDVIDGEVEITPMVDYYSLGITLMTVWLGENPFSNSERLMTRQKNEGQLPRIDELPERVRTLVRGLTTVNPETRWKYDEVERWFNGEQVKVDTASPFMKYKKFIFDPDQSIIAQNAKEMATLLIDNPRLGRQYLYNKKISQWLEDCNNGKLSLQINNIIDNLYPADQEAGLLASVYTLDPDYPYQDIHGNKCADVHSVVLSMLSYIDEYAIALQRPNNSLFLYLETHSQYRTSRMRNNFIGIGEDKEKGRIAVLKTVYEADPDVPFLFSQQASTLSDIVNAFGSGKCSDDDWQSLIDGRFQAWMTTHCDDTLQESLSILQAQNDGSRSFAYKTLYNICRTAAFDLRDADTPEKVGEMLLGQLRQLQYADAETFAKGIADYSSRDGRLAFYMSLHGWIQQATDQKVCFDFKSKENIERFGNYDLPTAAYRFVRMLGVNPVYQLSDGTLLDDGLSLSKSKQPLIREELREGKFAAWLAVFYHEDPLCDFSQPYNYERRLVDWLNVLGGLDPSYTFYKRFKEAQNTTNKKIENTRSRWKEVKKTEIIWRLICYGLGLLWIILVLFFGIPLKSAMLDNRFLAMILPIGIPTGLILGTRAYLHGYGSFMSILWGIGGFLTAYIPAYLLVNLNTTHPELFNAGVVAVSLVYLLVSHFTNIKPDQNEAKRLIDEVLNDDVKTKLLDPLYYTFKSKSFKYRGSKFGVLDDIIDHVDSMSGESTLHYLLWCLLWVTIIVEFSFFQFFYK